ncbi:MAG TPA: glutathione-disulfide reductase [Caulobacteraceae bacterium]|jgi:glutathione reductase (NADPH)
MAYDYDLFVIGAGSGGVRAARLAALSGARVGVAEEDRVGGTCVIRGCIPKKLMVYASEVNHKLEIAKGYGWEGCESPRFNWQAFLQSKDSEIARLSGIYVTNLANAGAELVHAKARLKDAHTIELIGKGEVSANKILISTGGRPWLPDSGELPGIEHAITSDDAFHLPELPRSILIAGGGYIAVEFACIFAGLGVDTTLVYRGPNILRGFDEDVRAHLTEAIVHRGVNVLVSTQHERIEKAAEGLVHHLTNGMAPATDVAMFAVGRRPYVEGLGLEAAGVELTETGAIKVDDYSRTSAGHIWAVGDVTDRINLTPVAIREGAAFAETEFRGNPTTYDHEMVPTAVFSQPPVGTVGLSETEARRLHKKIDIYRTRFRPMKTAFAHSDERMLMKLVVDAESERILGCHIVGDDAPEVIQVAAIAVKLGVTKSQWDSVTALHPTAAEELVTMREKYVPMELGLG